MGLSKKFKRYKELKKKLDECRESGLTVLMVYDWLAGAGCHIHKDRGNPDNYKVWSYLRGHEEELPDNLLYVPCDYRTVASERGPKEYTYFGSSGLSWSVPYLAGVIALGYQVNPNLQPDQILNYIRETGTPFNRGKLINPNAFIEKCKTN